MGSALFRLSFVPRLERGSPAKAHGITVETPDQVGGQALYDDGAHS